MTLETVIALAIILIIIIIIVLMGGKGRAEWKKDVEKKLSELDRKAVAKDSDVLKNLLIDADKLLDHTLKQLGMKGDSLGERLKSSRRLFNFKEYDEIWKAHKERNNIVHEIDHRVQGKKLRDHYYTLNKAIKKLVR